MRKKLTPTLLLFLVGILITPAWAWQIERPLRSSDHVYSLPSRVENCSTDGTASVGIGVNPTDYVEEFGDYNNSDFISLNVSMTANSRRHISYVTSETSLFWIDYDSGRDTRLLGVGDDEGFPVDLTIPESPNWVFRFWGGAGDSDFGTKGSAEYRSVWICTNGFLAFDGSNSTSPTPTDIPNPQAPNAIIAAVWSDLSVDDEASIYYGWRPLGEGFHDWSFFVTWNNTLHKDSGERLTFQIGLIENAPGYYGNPYIAWGQSRFRVSYHENVSNITTPFAFGIEDQEGYKGLGDLFWGWELSCRQSHTYWFEQAEDSSNYFLSKLTLNFNDTCTQTRFCIREKAEFLRGYNVALKEPKSPDSEGRYRLALTGGKVLLATFSGVMVGVKFISLMLLGEQVVSELARNMYSTIDYLELRDQLGDDQIPRGAYVVASVPPGYERPNGSAVDALIGVRVHWILDDNNDMEHLLMVTAKLEYYEVDCDGYVVGPPHTITTSVNLKVTPDSPDKVNNNSFENATEVQEGTYLWLYIDEDYDEDDYYEVQVSKNTLLRVELNLSENLDFDVNLYLYNSTYSLIDSSENPAGQDEFVHGEQLQHPSEWWYIKAHAVDGYGFYNMTVSFVNRPPNIPSKPSGETSGYTYIRYTYSTSTTDPDGDDVRYQFDWGDDTRDTTDWHDSGETVSAGHHWTSSGTYKVQARAQDPTGASTGAWSDWSPKHTVTITAHPGCPILSVYDGTQYVLEGLLDIHNPDGTDVTTSRLLTVTPEPVEHRYLMRLTEHPKTHSHIDQVRLLATLENGIKIRLPLVSAVHSADGNVLLKLLFSDDVRADILGADHNNGTSEYITLEFVALERLEIEKFTFIIEGHNAWEK